MKLPAPVPFECWNTAEPGTVLAVVGDYEALLQSLKARLELAGITYAEADSLSGMADGWTAKVFGPGRIKNLGPLSLSTYLPMLKLKLAVVADGTPVPVRPKHVEQDRFPWQPDGALLKAVGAI